MVIIGMAFFLGPNFLGIVILCWIKPRGLDMFSSPERMGTSNRLE
jgi:hypothetical protein